VDYYPIFVDLRDRPVLVVGGGNVAEGKVQGLLAAHARVTVVAPHLSKTLANLETAGEIDCLPREYESDDLDGKAICFVATDDGAINARVAADCRERGLWVNAADDPANCDFILPAVVRSGKIVLAASTGGSSPAVARRLREDLTAFLDEGYAPLADLLADLRREIRTANLRIDPETWQSAIDPRVRTLVVQGRLEEARSQLREALGFEPSAARPEA
jgi:precorrin-2 dehydrogenase